MGIRRVSSWRIESAGWFRRRFFVTSGRYFEVSRKRYRRMEDELDREGVVEVGRDGDRVLWWTQAGVFWADAELSAEDVMLLVLDRQRRQDAKLDRLRREASLRLRGR